MTRIQNSLGLGLALLTALSLTAFNSHHERGKASIGVSIDPTLAAEVFAGQNSKGVPLRDLLRVALTVQNDGDPVALVLHTFEIENGRTISKFQSKAFTAPSGSWLLPQEYQPGIPVFQHVSKDGLTTTRKAVPVDVGVAEPGKFVTKTGEFANKPDGWEEMNAFYFIVVPEKSTSKSDMTTPAAVFIMLEKVSD